jgi:hypothetical protein
VEVEDDLPLPAFQPAVAWESCVVPVGRTAAGLPREELAHAQAEPAEQFGHREFGAGRPPLDEGDDRVACRLGNPEAVQSSPRSSFSWI